MAKNQNLVSLLRKIRNNLAENSHMSEADLCRTIIDPILKSLGWDVENRLMVRTEYVLKGEGDRARMVDYALLHNGNPYVVIEAKAVGRIAGAESQLFQYIYDAGALLAVLTDGKEWRIYLTFTTGSQEEKLVRNIDIAENDPEEAADYLIRYLSYEKVVSEHASQNAREDLKKSANHKKAYNTIPSTWNNIIRDEDSQTVAELINRVAAICGTPPKKEDVINFLKNLGKGEIEPPKPQNRPSLERERRYPTPRREKSEGARACSFTFFGEESHHSYASDAYIKILQKLNERDSNFMEKFAKEVNTNRTTYITRQEEDLPLLKNGKRNARKIGVWYVNMTLSNSDKTYFLQRACEVAGVKFGTDLKINFPRARS